MKKVVSLLVLMLLVFCFMSPVTAAVVFYDYFDRLDGDPGSDWDVISGPWAIENNELSQNESLHYPNCIAEPFGGTDYTAEVRIKSIDAAAIALITRYVDENNYIAAYYYFAYAKDKIAVWEKVGGTWHLRGAHVFAKTANYDVWYTLKVSLSGSQIEVYLDDDLVLTDNSIVAASGKIGLTSYYGHAHFDNVIVDNPNSFHAIPEPAPVIISVSFAAALATYLLIRKRSSNKTIIKP